MDLNFQFQFMFAQHNTSCLTICKSHVFVKAAYLLLERLAGAGETLSKNIQLTLSLHCLTCDNTKTWMYANDHKFVEISLS